MGWPVLASNTEAIKFGRFYYEGGGGGGGGGSLKFLQHLRGDQKKFTHTVGDH